MRLSTEGSHHPHTRFQSGFSLIEIVLALGILTFALVGLLALFPMALDTAADSKAETRVTQIAQTLFADITRSDLTACRITTGPDLQVDFENVNLSLDSTGSPMILAFNESGQVVGRLSGAEYSSGSNKGVYMARIVSRPQSTVSPLLSTITLSIETPSAAPESGRKKYTFITVKGEL